MKFFVSMKKHRESKKRIPFFSRLDLLAVEEDGSIVGVSGKTGIGFRLEGVDFLLFEEARREVFFNELAKLMNQMPEEITVSFHKRKSLGNPELLKEYQNALVMEDPLTKVIAGAKLEAFKNQRLVKKELFLFIAIKQKSNIKGKNFEEVMKLEESRIAVTGAAELIRKTLRSLGVKAERLSKTEILNEYYRKLNPSLSDVVSLGEWFHEDTGFPRYETLRSKLLLNPPWVSDEYFYLDGFYHAVSNLRILPEEASLGMIKHFESALPDESEIVLTIRKPEQEKEVSKMKVRFNLAKANAFFRIMQDHFAQERQRQYEEFLQRLAEEGGRIFDISLSVLVKGKSETELQDKKAEVIKAFPKMNHALGVIDHLEHAELFLTHLPIQGDENPVSFSVETGGLVRMLPLLEEWKGTRKPEILLKTYQDEALKLDLFDPVLPAKHALMVGSTGSGKSFITNFLLTQFLIADPKNHVVVIDMGGSYRKLARVLGGGYLEMDLTEDYALELFPEKGRFFADGKNFDSDLLAFLSTLIEKLVTEREKLGPTDLRILEKAILKIYEVLPREGRPLLADVANILRNYSLGDEDDRKRAYQFSKNLSIWTEGRFGKILNRPGKLKLDNRLLVFDLGKLSSYPELQAILFFVIRSAISRKLYDTSIKKMIVIDEGWRFFNDDIGGRLIEELYRTARKHNGLVLSISQSPEDFLSSKASTAILANSYVKYILKLQKGHDLLKNLDLNECEIQAVRELEIRPGLYSEIFIKFFDRPVIAKLEPSGLDYWISTTDSEDFQAEENFRKSKPHLKPIELLKALAREFPHGAKKLEEGKDSKASA